MATIGLNPRKRARRPSPKPDASTTGPPALTYDPALEAQRRAAKRGLEDTRADIKTERHFATNDLHQALKTIRVNTSRKRQDLNRQAFRGQRKLDYQEQNVRQRADRAQTDFKTRLADIAQKFSDLGHRQGEAANASGVADRGTEAAAAAARKRNQGRAEAPIRTAQQRTEEDLATALSRITSGREELGNDVTRALKRLVHDRNRNRMLSRREYKRDAFGLNRKEQRAIREGGIADIDLLLQEIYQSRTNHPGAFAKWSRENPGVVAGAKAGTAGSGRTNRRRHR